MPTITGVSPQAFGDGRSVTVTGSGFGASGTVTIGGVLQAILDWQDTEIKFVAVRNTQSMGPAQLEVLSDVLYYPYVVYPISSDGIFSNDTIPNLAARWRVVSADDPTRWVWYDGGGYTFDASGAAPGVYVAMYEVQNWDNYGNNATATVSVTVTA